MMVQQINAVPFKRGASFSLALAIPETVVDGYFSTWTAKARIRRWLNTMPSGLIAELSCRWENPTLTRKLILEHHHTENWPIGLAQAEVIFTAADGRKTRSQTMLFDIRSGIA